MKSSLCHSRSFGFSVALLIATSIGSSAVLHAQTPADSGRKALRETPFTLKSCRVPEIPEIMKCGTYRVYEDRDRREGRRLGLSVMVLPSRRTPPAADPVFFLYGGPGQTATEYVADQLNAWYRDNREVVLVDQRGTSRNNALNCHMIGPEVTLQEYFEPMFQVARFRRCRSELDSIADLRLYSTSIAMDDLDEIREALGYRQINLMGGSYGSRAALVYIRQHPERVRTVSLVAQNPFSFRNPLFHARTAQEALDSLFSACDRQPQCRATFPRIRQEFQAVLTRLARTPQPVKLEHPETGTRGVATIGRTQFAEALRVMTYTPDGASRVPLLIHRAFEGDVTPFAATGLASNYGLRSILRHGMLMSTLCSEDVARITEEAIVRETRNTYLGDTRVREQIAACKEWPTARLPANYAEPFSANVPALLVSGRYDPASSQRFGEEVHRRYLPNSVHLVIGEAGHSPRSPCIDSIARVFLHKASVAGLDTSCVATIKLRPFLTQEPQPAART
jgi:pimeloyl-ACP methyl ester carboxylesterase